MDLQDLWQEHKRWILGIAAGLVLFWIGNLVIDKVLFDAGPAERGVRQAIAAVRREKLYDGKARKLAEEQRDALVAAETRLREALEFRPSDEFLLTGKGDPDTHFDEVSRRVRRELLDRAQVYGVEVADQNLRWNPPVGRREIAATLIGLGILEQAVLRLLEASETARRQEVDAIGLESIELFGIDKPAQAPRRARRASAEADVGDRVEEYQVSFGFRADLTTLHLFLEKCRAERPVINLAPDLKVQPGRQPGDPLIIKGKLSAITLRES